jgi:RHH-type rel operon transcriptional repressor/antitoxin RelB
LHEIIVGGIAEVKEYYLAADVLGRVRKGQEEVYSSASVRNDLGRED